MDVLSALAAGLIRCIYIDGLYQLMQDIRGKRLEVIDCQPSIDFLQDVFFFSGMEIHQPDCIFQLTKTGFNPPYADILEMPILSFPKYRIYNTLYIYRHFLL